MKEIKTQKELDKFSKEHPNEWCSVGGGGEFVARGRSTVVARDHSTVAARDHSTVVAWDQSTVVARDHSTVVAWDQSTVVAWDQSTVEAISPYVSILCRSFFAQVSGGVRIGDVPLSPTEWLALCNIQIKRGQVILFKSVKPDLTSQGNFRYTVGKYVSAPDWNAASSEECGKGLHFSPTVAQAKLFRNEGTYIACKVKVSEMANLPAFAAYLDKIRARGCKVLYRCDEQGKRLKDV